MFKRRGGSGAAGYLAANLAAGGGDAARGSAGGIGGGLLSRARNWLRLSLVGSVGILSALVMDLQNRGDNSALFVVARSAVYLAALIGVLAVPLWVVVVGLMGVGAAVVLYFKPSGLRAAFAQGFGTLAAVMTLVPGYGGEAIGVPTEGMEGAVPVIREGDADAIAGGVTARADLPAPILASFVQADEAPAPAPETVPETVPGGGYTIRVRLDFPNGPPEPLALRIKQGRLKARLYNPVTGKAYNLFLSAGAPIIREEDRLLVTTTVPSDAPEATLLLRVEADGYEIAVAEATCQHGANEIWDVAMVPTSEPLLFQRLKHSYAF